VDYLKVKNWEEYQHYKDRNPPWIKLHVRLLNDRQFSSLSLASRGLLMQLWILASEHDGQVPNDLEEIKFRLRDSSIKAENLNHLIDKGFLDNGKQPLASASERYSETEERQRREETDIWASFEQFWKAYPKKKNKGQAERAWRKVNKPKETLKLILKALEWQRQSDQWTKENGQFIPHPATYLNAKGWEDEKEDGLTNAERKFLAGD